MPGGRLAPPLEITPPVGLLTPTQMGGSVLAMNALTTQVGQELDRLRESAGLSIGALSERSGVPRESLRRYLVDADPMRNRDLVRLARALGTTPRRIWHAAEKASAA